jgi:tRNA uridine 5-carboxymethylaminomethyl modification enzyme
VALSDLRAELTGATYSPKQLAAYGITVNQDGVRRSAFDLLALAEITLEKIAELCPAIVGQPAELLEQVQIDSRYAGYLTRQEADIRAFRKDESLRLSPDLAYDKIGGLSNEARQKLAAVRPITLGAASRIPGITPAALTALLRYVQRSDRSDAAPVAAAE